MFFTICFRALVRVPKLNYAGNQASIRRSDKYLHEFLKKISLFSFFSNLAGDNIDKLASIKFARDGGFS